MPDCFPNALLFVLKNEGGFCQTDGDKGGATNMGVTIGTLSAWRQSKGLPAATVNDVRTLTVAEAGAIYRANYFDRNSLSLITSAAVATALFDAGVLNGPGSAAIAAQTIAVAITGQALKVDGQLGPKTIAAINACPEARFVRLLQRRQAKAYLNIILRDASQAQFYDSWLNRTFAYADLLPAASAIASA